MNIIKELKLMIYESTLDHEDKEDLLNIVESTDDEEILSEVIYVLEASKEEANKYVVAGFNKRHNKENTKEKYTDNYDLLTNPKSNYRKRLIRDGYKETDKHIDRIMDRNIPREFYSAKDKLASKSIKLQKEKERIRSKINSNSRKYDKLDKIDKLLGGKVDSIKTAKDVQNALGYMNDKKYKDKEREQVYNQMKMNILKKNKHNPSVMYKANKIIKESALEAYSEGVISKEELLEYFE